MRCKHFVKNRTVWRHGRTYGQFDDPDEKKNRADDPRKMSLKHFFANRKKAPKGVKRRR